MKFTATALLIVASVVVLSIIVTATVITVKSKKPNQSWWAATKETLSKGWNSNSKESPGLNDSTYIEEQEEEEDLFQKVLDDAREVNQYDVTKTPTISRSYSAPGSEEFKRLADTSFNEYIEGKKLQSKLTTPLYLSEPVSTELMLYTGDYGAKDDKLLKNPFVKQSLGYNPGVSIFKH